MRLFLLALALVVGSGCSRQASETPPAAAAAPSLRIALVTDLKGYLEPCGCTSNPLGGIDRLAAQIRALRSDGPPVLFVVAGDVFFDTAELEPARVDQARRNANTLSKILGSLGVDAALPGTRDRAQPGAALAELRKSTTFPWLAMEQPTEVWTTDLGATKVAVVGVQPGTPRDAVKNAVAGLSPTTDLIAVLVDGSRRDANRIGAVEGVDFVVQGGLDQDAPMAPRPAGSGWVVHAGRQGQGLTVLDVFEPATEGPFVDRSEWSRREHASQLDRQIAELSSKLDAWEASDDVESADLQPQRARLAELKAQRSALEGPAPAVEGRAFAARWIPLPKRSERDAEVEALMREHDKVVNQANRVAFADLAPPPLGPDDVAYIGSAACSGCHQQAYAWWRGHSHGNAYLTLQQRNKQYNLDCVGCHVTGYQEPGGSTVTHNLDGALTNVGCESCHGPGAAHAKEPEEVHLVRMTPETTCVVCHNEEHSDLFEYDEYVGTLRAPGHGFPSTLP